MFPNPSLVSLVHLAGLAAGLRGSGMSYCPSGACLVTFPIAPGLRWSLAVSLLCRSLSVLGIRHRVIRWGAGNIKSARSFRGFAVLIPRGLYL